jgi:tRNA(adenine34) deaminase
MEEHEKWMRNCLALAGQALERGNPPVGSVLVQAGGLIGEGAEAGKTKNDITCHAEIEAIRDAIQRHGASAVRGATLYSTHEPCLMCAYVIRHHQVSRVVVGTTVPAMGGFSSAYPLLTATDIPIWSPPPHIVEGVLREACQALSQEYARKKNQPAGGETDPPPALR